MPMLVKTIESLTLASLFMVAFFLGLNDAIAESDSMETAIFNGQESAVRQLLKTEHYTQKDLSDYLIFAVSRNAFNIVELLLEAGADVNSKSLFEAGDPPVVYPDYVAATPVLVAALRKNLDMVDLLIKAGADLNVSTSLGTPLYVAVALNQLETAKRLIEAGADSTIIQRAPKEYSLGFAMSPLPAALSKSNLAMIELLLEADAYKCGSFMESIVLDDMATKTSNQKIIDLISLEREKCEQ